MLVWTNWRPRLIHSLWTDRENIVYSHEMMDISSHIWTTAYVHSEIKLSSLLFLFFYAMCLSFVIWTLFSYSCVPQKNLWPWSDLFWARSSGEPGRGHGLPQVLLWALWVMFNYAYSCFALHKYSYKLHTLTICISVFRYHPCVWLFQCWVRTTSLCTPLSSILMFISSGRMLPVLRISGWRSTSTARAAHVAASRRRHVCGIAVMASGLTSTSTAQGLQPPPYSEPHRTGKNTPIARLRFSVI